MPTYEYACKKCGQHTEAVQSFHDAPLAVCPHCGGELRKVFGAVGITFKGSGFYKTDSRPRPKESSGATKSSGSDGASSGSSATDKTGSDKTGSDKTGSDKAGSGKGTSSSAANGSGSKTSTTTKT